MSTKNISDFFSDFSIDNVRDFVEKYLIQIVYGACFISVAIFLTIYTINKKTNRENELIVSYYQAINEVRNDRSEEAIKTLENIYNSKYADKNIKTISGIRMAEILNSNNQVDKAVKIYEDIYNFKKNDEFLRNLSGLAALSILINENNPQNYLKIEKLVKSLNSTNNPIILLVHEQEGMFEIQRENKEKGIEILNNILLEEGLDDDTKSRVESVLELYKNEK